METLPGPFSLGGNISDEQTWLSRNIAKHKFVFFSGYIFHLPRGTDEQIEGYKCRIGKRLPFTHRIACASSELNSILTCR